MKRKLWGQTEVPQIGARVRSLNVANESLLFKTVSLAPVSAGALSQILLLRLLSGPYREPVLILDKVSPRGRMWETATEPCNDRGHNDKLRGIQLYRRLQP